MERRAIIDIGSNSVRLIIYHINEHSNFEVIDEAKETIRLGSYLTKNNYLIDDGIEIAINVLKRFEPNTFPTAISLLPLIDEIALTASSGALVPNDTIVKPTITDGIPNLFEMLDAPLTKISAPLINRKKPIIKNI